MAQSFVCPHCKKSFEISDALSHEIEEKIVAEIESKHKIELESVKRETELHIKKTLEEKQAMEFEDLKRELMESKQKNDEFRHHELELREQARKLESEKKEFELTIQRKLDDERKIIVKEEAERQHFKDLEYEKKINDLKSALDDAQRKASQSSQQLQGEVLELDLEQKLAEAFPTDEIVPIGKGVVGADIRQIVKTSRGNVCGTILWETKRTKSWDNSWIEKLKTNLRSEKANVAIIVSTTLPKEFTSEMGFKDGVWVCSFAMAEVISELMRQRLIDLAREKFLAQNKESKAEELYSYIIGHEFVQEIESLVEVHMETLSQVNRERSAFEKQWKAREENAKKLLKSTGRMVGSIQGLLGSSNTLHIKGLDLMELDSGE